MFVWTVSSFSLRGRAARTVTAVALLASLTTFASACNGGTPAADDGDSGVATTTGASAAETASPTEAADATGSAETGAPEVLPDPFELNRANVKLLPFRVRFNRLQQLTGLPAEDPVFDILRARRYELGDYDYASGVNPDLTWTASRISVWISAMLPVCRSAAMMKRFPRFPDDLAALITTAYGLPVTDDELSDYATLLGDASLDEAARHDSICVAVLTALEFVAK